MSGLSKKTSNNLDIDELLKNNDNLLSLLTILSLSVNNCSN